MIPYKRPAVFVSFAVLLTSLTACGNGQLAKNLEQSFAADPRLQNNPVSFGSANNGEQQNNTTVQLPDDFPAEIPRYRDAQLTVVTPATTNSSDESRLVTTRWVSSDPTNLIEGFYLNQFRANNWEILRQPSDEQGGVIEARRNNLSVTVNVQPQASTRTPNATPNQPSPATAFTIQYLRNALQTAQGTGSTTNDTLPEPGDTAFIGPTPSTDSSTQASTTPDAVTATATTDSQQFSDVNKAPQQLRQYIQDLAGLGILRLKSDGSKSNLTATTTQFEPGKTINRREYARWLIAANNAMHGSNPAKQIRLASESTQPAFQDVQRTDPDFPAIQGLAEAGLIPSPLSGDSTAVLFRPDAPLTREQLLMWKGPLDTRQALPNATLDSIKQTWGFQDAAKVDPKALRALLADFQNAEQSNIRRIYGYTTLFQPKKPVTRAEAAAGLWYFGTATEGLSAQELLKLQRPQSEASSSSSQ